MATWPANGATDWNTLMLAYLAVEHNTDGTHKAAALSDGGTTTTTDSESNTLLKAHAYKAQTAGFAYGRVAADNVELKAFLGTTDNPAGAGIHLWSAGSSSTSNSGSGLFVPKDQYFEFTSTGTVTINWTPLITGGAAPIDQD